MPATDPAHVLVVARDTGATSSLVDAVRARAASGPCWFHVLIPAPAGRHGMEQAEQALADAVPALESAAHRPVDGSVSPRHDPMDAIEETLLAGDFDEIILATVQHAVSHWLHVDLPRRVAHLGLPLTTVIESGG